MIVASGLQKRWKIFWGGLRGTLRARRTPGPKTAESKPISRKGVTPMKSRVAVVRKPTVEEMIKRAIELAGGMEISPLLEGVHKDSPAQIPREISIARRGI
jgi:hypothetical protein